MDTKLFINRTKLLQILFLAFFASIFFPIRHVFLTPSAYILGQYSDFTSFSLYLSDILILTMCLWLILPRGKALKSIVNCQLSIVFFLCWLILDLIWHFRIISTLNLYYSLKYAELIVSCGTAYWVFQETSIKSTFFKLFGIFSTFEAILALWQFKIQHSVGGILHKLGEQVLSRNIIGTSNIVSGGTKFIRAYGTFPHPNVLSAFIVSGVLVCTYLFIRSDSKKAQVFWGVAMILNIFGLTTSFSRAGFLSLAIGLVVFFGYLLVSRQTNKTTWLAAALISLALIGSFLTFKTYLLTRETVTDDASTQRITFAQTGFKMIGKNPMFGLGIGESLLHMEQYSPVHLEPWEIQPIHNYFVLAGAELGIPGALIFIFIFFSLLVKIIKKLRQQNDSKLVTYNLLLVTLFCIFLILMQFDHYFYTLQQPQLLLWIFLGLLLAETKNPHPPTGGRGLRLISKT